MDLLFPSHIRAIEPLAVLSPNPDARTFPLGPGSGSVADLNGRKASRSNPDRPWVVANMVMSADGSYSAGGKSGGLSGTADRQMFHVLRGLCDVVLVGAGTARTERYRRPSSDPTTSEDRLRRGQTPAPRLALVSNSGRFPGDQPFLDGDGPAPVVFVPGEALADAPAGAAAGALEYRGVGTGSVDLGAAIDQLGDDGAELVLCEGGPRLLGDLCELGLLDQIFVTLAPRLVAGDHTGILGNRPELTLELTLVGLVEDKGFLLLNYLVGTHPVAT